MSTHAASVSGIHVQALNSIDLEFQEKVYSVVRTDWKTLLDHLGSFPKRESQSRQEAWEDRRQNLFATLLLNMGKSLKYEFDEVHIKKGIYAPEAHSQMENEQQMVRQGLISLLQGEKPLKMEVVHFPVAPQAAIDGEK